MIICFRQICEYVDVAAAKQSCCATWFRRLSYNPYTLLQKQPPRLIIIITAHYYYLGCITMETKKEVFSLTWLLLLGALHV